MTDERTAWLRGRLVALTRDLMLVPGTASNPEELRRCFSVVRNHLEAFDNVAITEFEHNDCPSMLAMPAGCDYAAVLMCAHLDVVSHSDPAAYRSEVRDGRIHGPGAGDMKGALAILLELFRAVHEERPDAPLGLVVTSDEEVGGASGMGYLFGEAGLRCDAALVPDGGSLDEITVEEKGILHLEVTSAGRDGHAARPWKADNAIEKLMAGLVEIRRFIDGLGEAGTTWQPTCATTLFSVRNQTINRIPAHARAVLDVRFPAPHTVSSILSGVKRTLGDQGETRVLTAADPTRLSPDPLFLEVTERVLGRKPKLIRDDGGSDSRYIAAHGIPVMMSRPLVGNLHAKDEWIDIESMLTLYRIYSEYLALRL